MSNKINQSKVYQSKCNINNINSSNNKINKLITWSIHKLRRILLLKECSKLFQWKISLCFWFC